MKTLKSMLFKKDPIQHWPFWTLCILLIRIPILIYFMHQGNQHFPERMVDGVVLKEVDYGYFLLPVDRYFEDGHYSYVNDRPYAGRMPGYAMPYYFLRLSVNKGTALVVLILLQIILAAIGACFLALLAYRLSKSRRVFLLTLLFYGTSLYYLRYDFSSITESPSTALFILFLYQFFTYWQAGYRTRLLWAGFFLTWAIFLRPFLGYILLPVGILLLINGFQGHSTLWHRIRPAFFFCLPFLIFEGAWITRNYQALNQFIPIESPMYESYGKTYSKTWLATRSFAASLDVESAYFEPGLAHWFRAASDKEAARYEMPDSWFEGVSFNRDSLEELRTLYHSFRDEPEPEKYLALEERIVPIADRYLEQVKQAQPLKYHVWNKLENVRRRVLTSGSSYLLLPSFDVMNPLQKFLKLYASACYYLVLILGSIGMVFMWRRAENSTVKVFVILGALHCLALPFLLPFTPATLENRYLFTLYPILCISMIILLNSIWERRFPRLESTD